MIKLFVGLGNPGPEYEATRHNAGFWWLDALAREWKLSLQPDRSYHGLVAAHHRGWPDRLAAGASDLHEPVGQVGGGAGTFLQDCAAGDHGRARRARHRPRSSSSSSAAAATPATTACATSMSNWAAPTTGACALVHRTSRREIGSDPLGAEEAVHPRIWSAIEDCNHAHSMQALPLLLAGDMPKKPPWLLHTKAVKTPPPAGAA